MDREEARARIAEEASSHDDDCDCRTCRAAAGDDEAFHGLYRQLM